MFKSIKGYMHSSFEGLVRVVDEVWRGAKNGQREPEIAQIAEDQAKESVTSFCGPCPNSNPLSDLHTVVITVRLESPNLNLKVNSSPVQITVFSNETPGQLTEGVLQTGHLSHVFQFEVARLVEAEQKNKSLQFLFNVSQGSPDLYSGAISLEMLWALLPQAKEKAKDDQEPPREITISLYHTKSQAQIKLLLTVQAARRPNELFFEQNKDQNYPDAPYIAQVTSHKIQNDIFALEHSNLSYSHNDPGKDLNSALMRGEVTFTLGQVRNIIYHLLVAVSKLRSSNMVHRNICPHNIYTRCQGGWQALPAKLTQGDVFLSGFEHAQNLYFLESLGATSFYASPITLEYASPETLARCYTDKCDIWAIGVLFLSLLLGRNPFLAASRTRVKQKIQQFGAQDIYKVPKDFQTSIKQMTSPTATLSSSAREIFPTFEGLFRQLSHYPECFEVVQKMLAPEDQRLSASEVLGLPFFKSGMKSPVLSHLVPATHGKESAVSQLQTAFTTAMFNVYKDKELSLATINRMFDRYDQYRSGFLKFTPLQTLLFSEKTLTPELKDLFHQVREGSEDMKSFRFCYHTFLYQLIINDLQICEAVINERFRSIDPLCRSSISFTLVDMIKAYPSLKPQLLRGFEEFGLDRQERYFQKEWLIMVYNKRNTLENYDFLV